MRNFVVKNDFNKSSVHRDKKNDYSRQWDMEEDDYADTENMGTDLGRGSTDGGEEHQEQLPKPT